MKTLLILLLIVLTGCSKENGERYVMDIEYQKCFLNNCRHVEDRVEVIFKERIQNDCKYYVPSLGEEFWSYCYQVDEAKARKRFVKACEDSGYKGCDGDVFDIYR